MSLSLALDTTGRGGSVALAEDGVVLGRADHDAAQGYAESLFGLMDAVLDQAGCERSEVLRIAVVTGPGSFTGLRIGVTTAKTVAHAGGLELWTAGTLELVACRPEGTGTAAIWPAASQAGSGHVWWRSTSSDEILRLAEAEALERSSADGRLVVRERALRDRLRASAPEGLRVEVAPALADRLAACVSRAQPPARRSDPASLAPLYAAPSQAERLHGLDLRAELERPIRPRPWT